MKALKPPCGLPDSRSNGVTGPSGAGASGKVSVRWGVDVGGDVGVKVTLWVGRSVEVAVGVMDWVGVAVDGSCVKVAGGVAVGAAGRSSVRTAVGVGDL